MSSHSEGPNQQGPGIEVGGNGDLTALGVSVKAVRARQAMVSPAPTNGTCQVLPSWPRTQSKKGPAMFLEIRNPQPRVFEICGDLDLETVSLVDEALGGLRQEGDVMVDLSQLSFLDATGLGCFLRLAGSLSNGGTLVLRGAHGIVRTAIQMAGLEGRGNIALDEDARDGADLLR